MKTFLIASGAATMVIIAISILGNYLSERPRPESAVRTSAKRHHDPKRTAYLADLLVNLCRPALADDAGLIRLPLNWSYYATHRDYTIFELEMLRRAINQRLDAEFDVLVRRIQQDQVCFIIRLFK